MSKPSSLPINEVERVTGIPRATLRMWEQRYGFPRPRRGENDVRSYPPEQVQRLRTIALLVRSGHRAGAVVALEPAQLRKLARDVTRQTVTEEPERQFLQLLRRHDPDALLAALKHLCATLGLERFALRIAAISMAVGANWQCGELQIFEEHAYVEAAQSVLRHALINLPASPAGGAPSVLLATVGEEQHGFGLLLAQAMFATEGCRCVPLGVRLPLPQAVAAARSYPCDILALSFSANCSARTVGDQLRELRRLLPPDVELWAGGRGTDAARRRVDDAKVVFVPELEDIRPQVARWREGRPG